MNLSSLYPIDFFLHPWWSLLGVLLFFLFLMNVFSWPLKKSYPYLPLKGKQHRFFYSLLFYSSVFIGFIGHLMLIMALLGPAQIKREEEDPLFRPSDGDVVLLIDLSRSMLADDFMPNRYSVVMKAVENFLEIIPKDHRLAFLFFSERLFAPMPLTFNRDFLKESLHLAAIGDLGHGTNLGDSLMYALRLLKDSEVEKKSIILITDGVGQVDLVDPLVAAEKAREMGVVIYPIGVGTQGNGATIPHYHEKRIIYREKIPGGSVDYKLMKQMANITKGVFFSIKEQGALLSSLQKIAGKKKMLPSFDIQSSFYDLSYDYWKIGLLFIFIFFMIDKLVFCRGGGLWMLKK